MPNFLKQITALTRQLLPTGRAFGNKEGGVNERLYISSDRNVEVMMSNANNVLNSILPDNDDFTADDATRWEERLGMITNSSVSLDDRKAAIIRKMNHPGTIPARQSADYLQDRLQSAGFDVYVHENNNGFSFADLLNDALDATEMGTPEMGTPDMINSIVYYSEWFSNVEMGTAEMGATQMGGLTFTNLIANSLYVEEDSSFDVGANNNRTFIIGGEVLGTVADIVTAREEEFRQLVLRLKPVKSVAGLFINYI